MMRAVVYMVDEDNIRWYRTSYAEWTTVKRLAGIYTLNDAKNHALCKLRYEKRPFKRLGVVWGPV